MFGSSLHLSTSQLVLYTVLAFAFGAFGYMLALNYRHRAGVTPWRLPAIVWALFWFISPLVGLILYVIASRFTSPSLGSPGPAPAAGSAAGNPYARYPHSGAPAGGTGTIAPGGYGAAPGVAVAAAPAEDSPPLPPRCWSADPAGRHELRYWDGTEWTEHVSDGGVITSDPL